MQAPTQAEDASILFSLIFASDSSRMNGADSSSVDYTARDLWFCGPLCDIAFDDDRAPVTAREAREFWCAAPPRSRGHLRP
jgi:hypothetical protein